MTLTQFLQETAALPGDTEILVLSPWGDTEAAAWVKRDALAEDDPVLESFPTNAILLTGEAN
jgi:hypothetical protein